jgi:hypothetical protein
MNLLAKRTPTVVEMQAQESVPVASSSAPLGYVSRTRGTVTAKWIASTAPMSATVVSSPLLFRWFSCVSSLSVPPPTLTQSSTRKMPLTDVKKCTTEEFTCRSRPGECIPLSWMCDDNPDCTDGSDEKACSKTVTKSTCMFSCLLLFRCLLTCFSLHCTH